MIARGAVVMLASLWTAAAMAQSPLSVEQVTPSRPKDAGAFGMRQVPSAVPTDRATVRQLEPGLREKAHPPGPALRADAPTAPSFDEAVLTPLRPASDSIDADEIARLLASGEAASIDAAAAIATTAVKPSPVPEEVADRLARQRAHQGLGR